jgi:hypothetical protein
MVRLFLVVSLASRKREGRKFELPFDNLRVNIHPAELNTIG